MLAMLLTFGVSYRHHHSLQTYRRTSLWMSTTMKPPSASINANKEPTRPSKSGKGEKIAIPIEARHVVRQIPSLDQIESKANNIEHNRASKEFCRRSGGYPDVEVKHEIYMQLYSSALKAFTEKAAAIPPTRSYLKPFSQSERLDDDLKTFGLM